MLTNAKLNYIMKCKQSGMALPLVLIFSAALLALGAAVLNYSMNERIIAGYYSQDIHKYYLAESGLEAGYAILQEDFYYQGEVSDSLDRGSFTVTFITVPPERRLIVAEGKLEQYSLELKMLVENNPAGDPIIIEWLGE